MGLSHLDRKPLNTPSSESSTVFSQGNAKTYSLKTLCVLLLYVTRYDQRASHVVGKREERTLTNR